MIDIRRVAVLALPLLLCACGGGGSDGGGAGNAKVGGFYNGFITSQPQNVTNDATAAISPNGEVFGYSFNGNVMVAGNFATSGSTLSGTFRSYAVTEEGSYFARGARSSEGIVSGQVAERSAITGAFNASGNDIGTFSFTYSPQASELAASLELLAGNYGNQDPNTGDSAALTITASGQLSGSTSDGCTQSGTVFAPQDPAVNVYLANVNETCPGRQAISGGGLVVRVVSGSVQGVIIGVSTATNAGVLVLQRL